MLSWPLIDVFDIDAKSIEKGVCRPSGEIWIAIAITPRCGSTAFCSILSKSGTLGNPAEILNPRGPAQWLLGNHRPDSLNQYFDYMACKIRTGNVCAFKTSWGDFEPLAKCEACVTFLERFSWIYLERREVFNQAVSLARARKSGKWHRKVDEPGATKSIPMTSKEIARARADLEAEKNGWDIFFKESGITPKRFVYEDLVQDLSPALTAVTEIAHLGNVPQLSWKDSDYLKLNQGG